MGVFELLERFAHLDLIDLDLIDLKGGTDVLANVSRERAFLSLRDRRFELVLDVGKGGSSWPVAREPTS